MRDSARVTFQLRTGSIVFAVAFLGLGASIATAQTPARDHGSRLRPQTQSTSLSVTDGSPAGGSLVVDFDKPAVKAEVARPASAEPTVTVERPRACTTGDSTLDAVVQEAGLRYGVDPCLVVAVMSQESGYRRNAVSPKGASGYMQLMPDTARRLGVSDIFDPRQNVHAGTRYLRMLLERFGGSVELALAGYNAGEGAVERYGRRIPPFAETQNYVRLISTKYRTRYAGQSAIRGSAPAPPPLAAPTGPARPPVAWQISVDFADDSGRP